MCSCCWRKEKAVSPRPSRETEEESESVSSDRDSDSSKTLTSDPRKSVRKKAEEPEYEYRKTLPSKMFDRSQVSFWSILKNSIGKELSRITMPIILNEPLSFVQRLCEYMEYAYLLQKAVTLPDPVERMEIVCAFVVSAMSSNYERLGKPFNPVLGETYECVRSDMGFKFVSEQVSHHPPITAFHAEGQDFNFYGTISPKLKFWGKTVEVIPKGLLTVEFKKLRETYSWENPVLIIHNVVVGNLWFEYKGELEVSVNTNRCKGVLQFKAQSWLKDGMQHVQGFVYEGRAKRRALYGSWARGMYSSAVSDYEEFQSNSALKEKHKMTEKVNIARLGYCTFNFDLPKQKTLWVANKRPPDATKFYQFSEFGMSLNEMLPTMENLPRTDARNRADIRLMEMGKMDQAAAEKERIEEKQRTARRVDKAAGKEFTPRWFRQQTDKSNVDQWLFTGDYWVRDWRRCQDIFGHTIQI